MSNMYNRWFSEPNSDGWKIHIEVYVKRMEDAVKLINEHAKEITEESKQWPPNK